MNNLLTERVFSTIDHNGDREQMTLPGVLQALGAGRDLEFSKLRRHQHHAWHAFLVQIAALVCHRRGMASPVLDEGSWADGLRDLAGGDDAWTLVVEDLAQPAFMQPPVPEESLEKFMPPSHTPDTLDVLLVGRNHDLKRGTVRHPRAEHWAYALISLQTMQGYLGGYYGIARMSSGDSSRPAVALAADDDWTSRFLRDCSVWLAARPALCASPWSYPGAGGHALLWTVPWSGAVSLSLESLDPFFVEVCRRVRLGLDAAGERFARVVRSKRARVDGKSRFGDTGDVWVPVSRDGRKSFNVSASGFHYKRLQELLLGGDWIPAAAQAAEGIDGPVVLVARSLARGQGKTRGYHERCLPIPGNVRRSLLVASARAELGARSATMVELAALARRKVLFPAVLALAQGGPDKLDFQDKRFESVLGALDKEIDRRFFPILFDTVDDDDERHQSLWEAVLWQLVQDVFAASSRHVPVPHARYYRAHAAAQRVLHGAARNNLPNAFHEATTEESA